jgi:glycosyltransferase involved in cell wall biosynthesis
MNILYAGTLPPHPGGSATVGAQLLAGFARRGHRVRALAPITADTLRSGDRFAAAHPAVGVTRFLVPYFENSPNNPAPDEYRRTEGVQVQEGMQRLIAQERPDIVIVGRETFAWHVPDIAHEHRLPSVLLVHGGTSAGIINGTIPPATAQHLLAQFRKVGGIVSVARHLTEHYRRWGFDRICAIQNGVDLQQFAPQPKDQALLTQLGIGRDDIVVAHVSNLKDLKRPLDIVSSAERALPQNPKLIYLIVGDGPLRAVTENACRERRVAERFRFTGWVEHEQVPTYLNLADIVVMPSESEALALVYLETMACGRLLLASDIPASREVVVDGETGILFRKADVADLSVKTLQAAGDPPLRATIGRRAREMVAAHAIEQTVDAYLSVFTAIVQEHQR